MNRSVLISCLAAVLLAGAGGFAAAQTAAPSAAPAAPTVVRLKNFAYVPATVTVKAGETVEFVNDDPVAHTVTATDAKAFDSGNMDQNAKWRHTFAKAGTYTFLCTYHTYMKGTVVVKDAQ
jgi:plastocyanin